ncbi:uncharacterized protein LOC141640589 [Silene latifolia]|uniref:uncharacterized protein LOC141640589 n=1 Tax=Silene latifolia TaxID=37657 RepID=UPI003D775D8A
MKGGERVQWQMNNFRDTVDECGTIYFAYEDNEFTFDNGQEGVANRQCRLDRAMITSSWLDSFPLAKLVYLVRELFDHAPIKVVLETRVEAVRANRFHFEQVWVGGEGCEDTVRHSWEAGDPDLMDTLQRCADNLSLEGCEYRENYKGLE